jgi:membrane-bound lytic murein transglycosylase D
VLATQVARARREGYFAARSQEEIPAGALQRPRGKPGKSGTVKVETVAGKRRVTYGVASGDSLWTIAQRFAVTAEEIRGWNGLPRGRGGLKVGQQLVIWPGATAPPSAAPPARAAAPASRPKPVPKAAAGQHTIQAGDTLGALARKYGVTVAQLRKWNRLKEGGVLRPGQPLAVTGP